MCARKTASFLIYKHFYDGHRASIQPGCKGNHLHILVSDLFLSKSGGLKKPSQCYEYEKLVGFAAKYDVAKPSCKQVKYVEAYFEYLKGYPRQLIAYSNDMTELAESGFFTPDEERFKKEANDWLLSFEEGEPSQARKVKSDEFKSSIPTPKITKADETFKQIKKYVTLSKEKNSTQLMRWAQNQPSIVRNHICEQLSRRKDFSQLVDKAVTGLKFEKVGNDWYDRLRKWSPKKSYISLEESIICLQAFHQHNNFNEISMPGNPSLTEQLDMILNKKLEKINTIIFLGESNAGKSLVMRSAFCVFPDCAQLYQGVANNFMFEPLEEAEVCMWEEARFSRHFQETIKLIMEGAECSVSAKYRKNVSIDRVPLGITSNVLPWKTILQQGHAKAFRNRCLLFKCKTKRGYLLIKTTGNILSQTW